MKNSLISKFLVLVLIFTICYSCSKGDENIIKGEWNLKSLETKCIQGNLNEEFETNESNGLCCITLSTTEITDTMEFTYTTTSCQKLLFKNDEQLDIISESNSSRDTITFTYQILDNNIEVCPIINQCVNYILINNNLELTLPIAFQSGVTCDRTFVYRR